MYSQRVLESHPAGCAGDELPSNHYGSRNVGRMQKELHTGIDFAVALIKQDTPVSYTHLTLPTIYSV